MEPGLFAITFVVIGYTAGLLAAEAQRTERVYKLDFSAKPLPQILPAKPLHCATVSETLDTRKVGTSSLNTAGPSGNSIACLL